MNSIIDRAFDDGFKEGRQQERARIVGIIKKQIKLYEDKITAKKLPSYPPYILEDLLKEIEKK
jgi:hypothetical protein